MSHLPETDSISELAAFWQTHDLTDFEDALEELKFPTFDSRMTTTSALINRVLAY
jgi:hypothetical protein